MLFVENPSETDPDTGAAITSLYPIAFGTTCTCDITADTIDASNKMGGNWKNTMVGQLGWTMQSDSLISKVSGHMSYVTLRKIMARRLPIMVVMGKIADTDEEFAQKAESGYVLSESDLQFVKGYAVITQLTMTAGQGSEMATCNISLAGDGPILDADVA